MEIYSKGKYPGSALSNFAGHRFQIDGVQCHSMEGFLQSLKFSNPEMQKEVCLKAGMAAKRKGFGKKWFRRQELHWMGRTYERQSDKYTQLIIRAYDCMFKQSESFRKALKASGNAILTHDMGGRSKSETILTRKEFIGNLNRLRGLL